MIAGQKITIERQSGFALIEIAIAIFVIAIVLAGIIAPLNSQVLQKKTSDTQRWLDDARDSVLGFVVANGRLPCPASAASNGFESPLGGGVCTNPYDGFLPAATLGITNTDGLGYAIDAWNARIHYAVSIANGSAFTTAGQIKLIGMAALTPDLHVCSTASTLLSCAPGVALVSNAPALFYSVGPDWASGGTGADEAQNPNPNGGSADNLYVYHTPTGSNSPNGEFDDMFTWISPYVIYSRMVSAGTLP